MKIREKLLVSVMIAVVFILVANAWLGYLASRKTIISEIQLHADSMLKAYAWELDADVAALPAFAHGMAIAVRSLYPTNGAHIEELIRITLETNDDAYGSAIAFAPGKFSKSTPLYSPYYFRTSKGLEYKDLADPNYDYLKWDWYKKPAESGKPRWSEPYVDVGGGDIPMITYSYPFFRNDELIGVATVDIGLDKLTDDIEKIVIGETGRAFLIDNNGTFLTLGEMDIDLENTIFDFAKGKPNEEGLVKLGQMMIAGESGFVEMNDPLGGKDAWVVYGPIPTTGWSLGIIFPSDELLGELKNLQRKVIAVSIGGIVIIFLAILLISSRISKPIRQLAKRARKIAAGDLTIESTGEAGHDEVGTLARSFHEMQLSLSETLEKLHEEKEMFTAAFTQMSDGLVILTPQWNALQYNSAAKKYLALPADGNVRDHILARFDCSISGEKIADALRKTIQFELTREESENFGKLYLAAIITPILGEDSELRELIMSVRDVTDQKAEDTFKANFLSLISHKLRTPVALLKSGTALMQDGLLGEMSEKQKKQIDSMTNQIGKLHSIIEVLIGYATIEGTALESAKEEIDLASFWDDIAAYAKRNYKEKNAEIFVDIATDAKSISFNKQYLAMIFSQLIDNALKFNMSDPAEVRIDIRHEDVLIVTEIKDNGVGIPPEYADRIYDRFFQIEKYFTGNVEGMGLGLSYVKMIVENFGGSIDLLSTPGEGSTFTVKLPG